MPPEPLPWDRKKHERSESSSSLGSTPRWRDWPSGSHYGSYREFTPRWTGGSGEFRRPSGHGKQGGWHMFAEEPGYGYTPSQSSDKMQEDDNGRPPFSRGDGKYGRSSRDSRGPFGQRDWRAHSWEMSNGSPNGPGRFHDVSNDQRSVDHMLTSPPSHPPNSDFVNTWDQLQLKEQHESNKEGGPGALGPGQRGEKENSLDWKPLKWTRAGSLSSRGSGYSHSSSSKSLGAVDSNGGKVEVMPKNATPIRSASVDAAAAVCVTSVAPSDETTSRKKPRLRWGEGLAKYEKRKVEGPEISLTRDGTVLFANNAEPVHSQSSSLAEKSPRLLGFPDCSSPATPSSVACSSSPGVEEKSSCKAINVDNDGSNLCGSPSFGSQSHPEGSSFSLEKLDISSIANMESSLTEMIQSEDLCSMDSNFVKLTGINKLLVWKGDVLKLLETTESEIDSLENELKSLKSDSKSKLQCPSSSSLAEHGDAIPFNGLGKFSGDSLRPPSLQVVSNKDEVLDKIPNPDGAFEAGGAGAKDDDIDSPGTATSKFIEPVLSVRTTSSDMLRYTEHSGMLAIEHSSLDSKCQVPMTSEKDSAVSPCAVNVLVSCSNHALVSAATTSLADGEDNVCAAILASNKESACTAAEEFKRLLPSDPCTVDCSRVASMLSVQTDRVIREKFIMRKRFMKFKEKVMALKFKAFQHLWKEDIHLLSVKKYKAKSLKKFDSSLGPIHNTHQKQRSSYRTRIYSPGNTSLAPTPEMLKFTGKLLADCNVKVYRDKLKMPAQILDDKEKIVSRFISGNGLVEDPYAVEKERAMINPWTPEERDVFIDKLASCGKDFTKIASFLEHKTTADCVEFYYKNHKSDSFGKVKKNKQAKSLTNYLMSSSSKKWNREMNSAAPLDVLGAASVVAAADSDRGMGSRKMHSTKIFIRGYGNNNCKILPDGDGKSSERSIKYDVLVNERETAAADVLAGISGSMSSCITTSADRGEGFHERKARKSGRDRRPSLSDVTQSVDEEETCSDESCGEMDPSADWTDDEKAAFIRAVSLYGKDFAIISRCVRTRSRDQCKVFFSKAKKCLGLDQIRSDRETAGPSLSEDANGGGSDMEDACAIENGLDDFPSKMDQDLPPPVMCTAGKNPTHDFCDVEARINLETDLNLSEDKEAAEEDMEEGDLMVVDAAVVSNGPKDNLLQSTHLVDGEVIDGFVHHNSLSMNGQKVSVVSGVTEGERECGINEGFSDSGFAGDAIDSGPSSGLVSVSEIEAKKEVPVKKSVSSLIQDLNITKEVLLPTPLDMGSSSNESPVTETMNQRQAEVSSVETSAAVMSFQLEISNMASADSVTVDSAVVTQCDKVHDSGGILGSVDVHQNSDKQDGRSFCGNVHVRPLLGHPVLNHWGSAQLSSACTAQIPLKELKDGISCRPISDGAVLLKNSEEIIMSKQLMAESCYLQNSSQHSEQASEQPRSLSEVEKPCRNGDVKLFGKILSTPVSLSQKRPAHPLEEHGHDENGSALPLKTSSSCSSSSTLKFTGHPTPSSSDGGNVASLLKFDQTNKCVAGGLVENSVPLRSYGFWDGSRIQTGLTSLPDSAILLAKYPAAFSNYPGVSSSPKIDPAAALHAVGKNSEQRSMNGIPSFPQKDVSSSGSNALLDFQRYLSHHDATNKVQQPFGFDSISSLQQHGMAAGAVGMGMSSIAAVRGGGGGVVGQAVSDPVAAIKMHFAKTEHHHQFGVSPNGGMINVKRQDDATSWRGKGDVLR